MNNVKLLAGIAEWRARSRSLPGQQCGVAPTGGGEDRVVVEDGLDELFQGLQGDAVAEDLFILVVP